MKTKLLLTLLGFCIATTALSQSIINWHPNLVPVFPPTNGIASGIDVNLQSGLRGNAKAYAAVMGASPVAIAPGDPSGVDVAFTQHQLDVAKSLSLNLSVSVDSFVASGSVGVSSVDNRNYSQNVLNFTYNAKRDYGTTRFAATGYTANFFNDVMFWKTNNGLSGEGLRRAIVQKYGTHYVSGFQSVIRVGVIYSFQYASQSIAQSFSASLSGNYDVVSFNSTVQRQLNSTDTTVTMSYHIDTSDPVTPPPVPTDGSITNYQQFLDFTGSLSNYVAGLPASRARVERWVLDPIENIPGYLQLVNDNNPLGSDNSDYSTFMTYYGQLQRWQNILSYLSLDPKHMSWLSGAGQSNVVQLRSDTTAYIQYLKGVAQQHFTNGTPLVVPDTIINYFANYSRIPLPTINTIIQSPNILNNGTAYKLGYIMCGPKDLTRNKSFNALIYQRNGQDADIALLYTMDEWIQVFTAIPTPFPPRVDATNTTTWRSLAALTNSQVLIFDAGIGVGQEPNYKLVLKDDAGNITESISFSTINVGLSPQSYEASTNSALSFGVVSRAVASTLDAATVHEFAVTNNGPGAAHGVSVTLPVPAGLQVINVGGSQGFGNVTNGNVNYAVGPIASGHSARIRLTVAARTTNTLTTASLVSTGIGPFLNNTGTNSTTPLPPITVQPPTLTHTRGNNFVELSWVSDTGLLNVERSSSIGKNPVWNSATNGVTMDKGVRKLRLPFDSNATFYRLRSQ